MDNRPSTRARRDAFDVYCAEAIIYRGYPVRRGLALLLEDELTGDIDRLIDLGNEAVTLEPALPDTHARDMIYAEDIEISRVQYSFIDPDWVTAPAR